MICALVHSHDSNHFENICFSWNVDSCFNTKAACFRCGHILSLNLHNACGVQESPISNKDPKRISTEGIETQRGEGVTNHLTVFNNSSDSEVLVHTVAAKGMMSLARDIALSNTSDTSPAKQSGGRLSNTSDIFHLICASSSGVAELMVWGIC